MSIKRPITKSSQTFFLKMFNNVWPYQYYLLFLH